MNIDIPADPASLLGKGHLLLWINNIPVSIDIPADIAILIIGTGNEQLNCLGSQKRNMYVRGGRFTGDRIVWYLLGIA